MHKVRLTVIAIGCLIAGPVLIYRHLTALPKLDELTTVSGEVALDTESRRTRYSTSQYPVLKVRGAPGRYKYLDWFPKADRITELLHSGERVTLWTDAGRNDWVWQIERAGQLIVSYQEVRDAVAANQRFDLWLGLGVLAIGLFAASSLYRTLRAQA